jgi:hypothetical protein
MASPFVSVSSRLTAPSFRLPMSAPTVARSSRPASSGMCSPFGFAVISFVAGLTSGMLFPITTAAAIRSGVPLLFCLFDATDGARFSATDCVEFCLPLTTAGLEAVVGGGDGFFTMLLSGKVLRIGEDANDGDMAIEDTVPFLCSA